MLDSNVLRALKRCMSDAAHNVIAAPRVVIAIIPSTDHTTLDKESELHVEIFLSQGHAKARLVAMVAMATVTPAKTLGIR
jgi:hypothetical protein